MDEDCWIPYAEILEIEPIIEPIKGWSRALYCIDCRKTHWIANLLVKNSLGWRNSCRHHQPNITSYRKGSSGLQAHFYARVADRYFYRLSEGETLSEVLYYGFDLPTECWLGFPNFKEENRRFCRCNEAFHLNRFDHLNYRPFLFFSYCFRRC